MNAFIEAGPFWNPACALQACAASLGKVPLRSVGASSTETLIRERAE